MVCIPRKYFLIMIILEEECPWLSLLKKVTLLFKLNPCLCLNKLRSVYMPMNNKSIENNAYNFILILDFNILQYTERL